MGEGSQRQGWDEAPEWGGLPPRCGPPGWERGSSVMGGVPWVGFRGCRREFIPGAQLPAAIAPPTPFRLREAVAPAELEAETPRDGIWPSHPWSGRRGPVWYPGAVQGSGGICQSSHAGPRPGSPLAVPSPRNRFWPVKGRGAQQQRSLDSKACLCPGCHAPWPRPPRPPSQGRFQRHCQTPLLAWSAGTCTLQLPESLSAWPALLCPHLPSTGDQSIQFHPHPDSHWASAPVPPSPWPTAP